MSSYSTPVLVSALKAAADYSTTGKYLFVSLNGVANEVATVGADEKTFGILQNAPKAGQVAEVAASGGGAKLEYAGTIDEGDYLKPDSAGAGVVAEPGEAFGAIAQDAGVDGDIRNVRPQIGIVPVVIIQVTISDLSTAGSGFVSSPVAGRIAKVESIIDGVLATADDTITMEVNGTAVNGLALTIAYSGSAAGDVDSDTPTAAHASAVVAAGDSLELITDGASTNTVTGVFNVHIVPKA